MKFVDDNLNESIIHFPNKLFSFNKEEEVNMTEVAEELTDDIREFKEEVNNTEVGQFYNKYKFYFNTVIDLFKNWAKFGLIMGAAVIPFSLSISLLKLLTRKALQYLKSESDKHMLVEELKMNIDQLKIIRNSNKENELIISKIDSTIDFLNSSLDILLEGE